MEVKELKAKIKSNKLPSFLIFTGDEWEVQKIYIQQIGKNMEMTRIESVTEILGKLKSKSFTSRKRTLYTVRDDKELMSNPKIQNRLERVLGDNILILLITKPDKRTKFYNRYKSTIVEFKPLDEANLKPYIKKQIDLSDKNCKTLIDICEGNYGRILLEIDKIKHWRIGYGQDKQMLMPEDNALLHLINDGTIYKPPKDAVFDLVDAILDNRPDKAFELYENCKGVGESTLVILTNLFNAAKAVLQVQNFSGKDMSKTTGLTGWQIMNAKKHLKVYDNAELLRLMKLITACERGIKTGKIEEQFVIEYIMVRTLYV